MICPSALFLSHIGGTFAAACGGKGFLPLDSVSSVSKRKGLTAK